MQMMEVEELVKIDCNVVKKFSLDGMTFYAKVIGVYDGDTVTVVFKYKGEYSKWSCRLAGIDTPELKTKNEKEKKAATEARDFLRGHILGKIVKIECEDFDKYGRLLVTIFDEDASININELMINEGYAKAYDGGTKEVFQ